MRGLFPDFFFPTNQENPAHTLWPEPDPSLPLSTLPGTPFPFLPEPPDKFDLSSFLTSKGVLASHLDNLQRLVETWYSLFESVNSDRCNLVSTALSLVNFSSTCSPLDAPAYEKALLTTFVMISVRSGEKGGHGLLGGYFHPVEWLVIYLWNNNCGEQVSRLLDRNEIFEVFNQLELWIKVLLGEALQKISARRCLLHWTIMREAVQTQLTGQRLFNNAFEVPTILSNQNISFVRRPVPTVADHHWLLRIKETMHIRKELLLITSSYQTTPLGFEIEGGWFDGDVIIELPLPIELLVSGVIEDLERAEKIEKWLGTISNFSFWHRITGFLEVEAPRLKAYAINTYRPDLVQSGQALSLLRQFLREPITTTRPFYTALGRAVKEVDATCTKIYWFMALLKKVLGPTRPVFTLPPNYNEGKARAVYARLEQMLGLQNHKALELSSIQICLERLNSDARAFSDPLHGFSVEFREFWGEAVGFSGCQKGVEAYQKMLTQHWPSWLPMLSFVPTENSKERRRVRLEDYAKALANCAQAALYYLNQCAAQVDDMDKLMALESFLKALVHYHLFSLFHLEGFSSTDRGDAYINSMAAPYQWHTPPGQLRNGEDFFNRQVKDLVFFLVLAKVLLGQGVFGQELCLLHSFVSYLTTHYVPLIAQEVQALPENQREQVSVVLGCPGLYKLVGQHKLGGQHEPPMLGLGFRAASQFLWGARLVPRDMEPPQSTAARCFLVLLHSAGHSPRDVYYKSPHGQWQKILPFYLFVVLVSQWVMLRAPIPSSTAGNQNATTTAPVAQTFTSSDIAFGWMMFLTLERLFENFGGCYQVLTHPATQGIFGLLMIATAIALQPLGYDLLDENPDDPNAVTLLVFGNSLLFVMMAGAPFKLAKQGSAVLSPLFPELILRFFYELIAACNQSPKKNRLVALHIQDVSRKILQAAIYTVAISVACLNFLSFLANLVANLPYNHSEEYAQDVTFGGVTAAILVPSIVFFWQIVSDSRFKWFKVLGELSQPGEALKTPLGVLDWIQLGLMIVVGGAAGLVVWLESLFLKYQHGANSSQIFANASYATPFITLKRDTELSSVTLAVVCFIAWQIIQAYVHIDKKPAGLVEPKDNLLGCSQIGRCMARLFACHLAEKPATQSLLKAHDRGYGAV